MKSNKSLLLLIALGIILGCKRIPEGHTLVRQSYLDSIKYIASLPPDTIINTIITHGDPVIIEKAAPFPVNVTDSSKTYIDSLVNKEIDAKVKLVVKGDLLGITWQYNPITREVEKIVKIPVPYPVETKVPVPTPQRGMFLMLGIGKGLDIDKPAISVNVFYQTRKAKLLGAEVGYFQEPYFQLRFGKKF